MPGMILWLERSAYNSLRNHWLGGLNLPSRNIHCHRSLSRSRTPTVTNEAKDGQDKEQWNSHSVVQEAKERDHIRQEIER